MYKPKAQWAVNVYPLKWLSFKEIENKKCCQGCGRIGTPLVGI